MTSGAYAEGVGGPSRPRGRLGVYLDDVYHVVEADDGREVSTDRSFLLFVCKVGESFDRLVLFGRTVHTSTPADYVLPGGVELVELPHYSALRRFFEVLRVLAGTTRAFWRGLSEVDVLWIFGPHPLAVLLVVLARARRKTVVLGVRQHSVRLYEARVTGWRRGPSLFAVRVLDAAYRLFARRLKATVQGAELDEHYGGPRRGLLEMTESIVPESEVAGDPAGRDFSGELHLLTVGRFESEKNPLLLVDALARLEAERPGRYRLTWVGRGPLEERVREHADAAGLRDRIEFIGYVPFDAGLLDLYRRSHIFVHVSLSEGMPKVLIEALACATPIVATDVGGVRAALDGGRAGALVPPDDLDALTGAITKLTDDDELRATLVARGLELAKDLTLEAQVRNVVSFIGGDSRPAGNS